jgi:hypothetical protein
MLSYDASIKETGDLNGKLTVTTKGAFDCDTRSRLKDLTPKRLKMLLEDLVSGISSGAKMTSNSMGTLDDPSKPCEFTVEFNAGGYASRQKDMLIFDFPGNPVSFTGVNLPSSSKRELPDYFDHPFEIVIKSSISLPEGFEDRFVSVPEKIQNKLGTVEITSYKDGDRIYFERHISIERKLISKEDYGLLMNLVRSYLLPKNNIMLLEKIAMGGNTKESEE